MFSESDQVALRSSLESLVLRGGLLGDPLHFSFHLGLEQKRRELPAILSVVSDMGKGDPNRLFPSTAREQKDQRTTETVHHRFQPHEHVGYPL